MKLKLILVFFIASMQMYAQETNSVQRYHTYSDFVEDEQGKRLQGITVKILGGDQDVTDFNGRFSVRAKKGDQINLYKNGEKIDYFIYDGSSQYQVYDDFEVVKSSSRINKSMNSSYKTMLDSANYYTKKKPLKSIQFVENALQATSNKKKSARAYEVLADAFYQLQQFDLAQSNYLIAYKSYPKDIFLQLKLAKAYYKNSFYDKSKKLFFEISNNKKAIPFQKINAFEGLASLEKKDENYKKTIRYLESALLLAKKHEVTPKITIINTKLAEVLSLKGEFTQSNTYMSNSIKSAKRESRNKGITQTNRAADFYAKSNFVTEEIQFRKKTLKKLEENDINVIKTHEKEVLTKPKVKYDIGKALVKQKKYKEAISYLSESATEANISKDIETEKEAIRGLSEVYAAIGDDKNAISNYNKLSKLVDFSFENKEKEIAKAKAISKDIANKQNRILSLEKDRALHDTNYKLSVSNSRRQQLIIYSLIGGLLLLLLSLFYMFRSNKQRKLANNLLSLKSLRSQMNPHFIFNALNSVNSFIATNDERAANRYLTDFSTLMRSVLENSEQDFIPLEQEIDLLGLYLKLEHSRFDDKFDYQFIIDKNVKINEFQIPPMLLQPYVENAVWHGLRYKKEKGLLKIEMKQKDNETLEIIISDNGIGRKKSKELKSENQQKNKSKGMQNIKQRIAILNEMYHDKVDVFISDLSQNEAGTKVVLTLKKD